MPLAIDTQTLTKSYTKDTGWRSAFSKNLANPAVSQVNLQVQQGELFGLVGPNGAGKTTLIKLLTTLVMPTSGNAIINGYTLDQELGIKRSVGLVTSDERSFYWRLSGQQNLEFFAALHGLGSAEAKNRSMRVLQQVGLQDHKNKPFQKYSTGMKQKLSIARSLLVYPKILFLDEPMKGIDPGAAQELRKLIKEKIAGKDGITVFLTSHNLDEVQRMCDRVAIMDHGNILACGSLTELREVTDSKTTFQIQVQGWDAKMNHSLSAAGIEIQLDAAENTQSTELVISASDIGSVNQAIDLIRQEGGLIEKITRRQITLNDIFSYFTRDNQRTETIPIVSDVHYKPLWQSRQGFFDDLIPDSVGHFLRVASAALRRDVSLEVSYRLSFLLQFLNIFFSVAVFYFVALLLGDSVNPYLEPYGGDYFSFVLIGIAFGSFFGVGLSSFSQNLRSAQMTGTLEAMLSTPTRISTIILSSSQWNYIITSLRVIIYLLIGTLFLDVQLGNANYWAAIVILLLTVITFSSLGIIAAGFIMFLKRGDPVTWIVGTISNLLGGIYYPIAVMPQWMQNLAKFIPVTYSLRAMRLALLQGASFQELRGDMIVLGIFCVVLLPLSLIVFGFAVRLARKDGSLTYY